MSKLGALAALMMTAAAPAQQVQAPVQDDWVVPVPGLPPGTPLGSGPYRALMDVASGPADKTVYRPVNMEKLGNATLPIVLWANGGCRSLGNRARWFMSEIASYGYFGIALGPIGPAAAEASEAPRRYDSPNPGIPGVRPQKIGDQETTARDLIDGLDWAMAENARRESPFFNRLDTSKIAVMGWSCGGVLAMQASMDPRISTAMIWNSGIPTPVVDFAREDLARLHAPTAFISGDERDTRAFHNSNDNFQELARLNRIPVLRASMSGLFHQGTFADPNGGEYANIAIAWLNWQLKGDQRAATYFVGRDCGLCVLPRWTVKKHKID